MIWRFGFYDFFYQSIVIRRILSFSHRDFCKALLTPSINPEPVEV
jgi:hypothetical protein